jgi:hypothetical protein
VQVPDEVAEEDSGLSSLNERLLPYLTASMWRVVLRLLHGESRLMSERQAGLVGGMVADAASEQIPANG